MNKVYLVKKNDSLIITEDYLAISSKKYKDYEEMKKKTELISMKSKFKIIPKKDIFKISCNEKSEKIKIEFSSETNLRNKYNLFPEFKDELLEIANDIHVTLNLNKIEKQENKTKYLLFGLLKVVFSIIATVTFVFIAIGFQNGEQINVSGKNRGIKRILMELVDFLGPIGVSIIGTLIVGYYIYKAIKRYKKPSLDIEFMKK